MPARNKRPPILDSEVVETTREVALRLELERVKRHYRNIFILGIVGVLLLVLLMDYGIRADDTARARIEENNQQILELIKRAYRADPDAYAEVVEQFPVLTKSRLPKKIRRFDDVPIVQQSANDNPALAQQNSIDPMLNGEAQVTLVDQLEQPEIEVPSAEESAQPLAETEVETDLPSDPVTQPDIGDEDIAGLAQNLDLPVVNLYSLRSEESYLIGQITDPSLIILSQPRNDNDWVNLMLAGGVMAWISKDYVEPISADRVLVSATRVGLRVRPEQSKETIVGLADTGDVLEVRAEQGNWLQIVVPAGFEGWSRADEVQALRDAVPVDGVTLYAEASEQALIMGALRSRVDIIDADTTDNWSELSLQRGLPVWISASYVSEVSAGEVTVTASRVGLRVRPQPNKRLIAGMVDTGDRLTVIDERNGWFQVETPPGFKVWAQASDLEGLAE